MTFLLYVLVGFIIGWSLNTHIRLKNTPLCDSPSDTPFHQNFHKGFLASFIFPSEAQTPKELSDYRENSVNADSCLSDFYDQNKLLHHRLSALKIALHKNHSALNDKLIDAIYRLLQKDNETCQHDYLLLLKHEQAHHPADLVYMLQLLEGHIDENKLTGLNQFLTSTHAGVRGTAVKVIAATDSHGTYRSRIEHIKTADPDTRVRNLAQQLLQKYYAPVAAVS